MPEYKINWRATIYGHSRVEADSIEEAKRKALRYEDVDFKEEDVGPDWEIESIKKMEEDTIGEERIKLLVRIKKPHASIEDFLRELEDFNKANRDTIEVVVLERLLEGSESSQK